MTILKSRANIFTVLPTGRAGSGARCVSGDGALLAASDTWVQIYIGDLAYDWDIANEGYFDGTDELVVPADGIYLINGAANLWKPVHPSSGYISASLRKNGTVVATYSLSYQQSDSRGSVEEPSICWTGFASAGDRFSIEVQNQTDEAMSVGYWSIYLCALRVG